MKNHDRKKVMANVLSPLLLGLFFTACISNAGEKTDAKRLKRVLDSEPRQIIMQDHSASEVSKMTKGEQIEHCMQNLAKKLNLEIDEVSLLTTRPVTWRSGALGCPEKGVSYTQALVSGRIIALAAGDQVYRYHTAINETPFLCPNSRAETPQIQPGDL